VWQAPPPQPGSSVPLRHERVLVDDGYVPSRHANRRSSYGADAGEGPPLTHSCMSNTQRSFGRSSDSPSMKQSVFHCQCV
jgi:hypothetical protein